MQRRFAATPSDASTGSRAAPAHANSELTFQSTMWSESSRLDRHAQRFDFLSKSMPRLEHRTRSPQKVRVTYTCRDLRGGLNYLIGRSVMRNHEPRRKAQHRWCWALPHSLLELSAGAPAAASAGRTQCLRRQPRARQAPRRCSRSILSNQSWFQVPAQAQSRLRVRVRAMRGSPEGVELSGS